MMIKYIKPDFEFKDTRGKLVQLCDKGWTQINVSKTKKDVKRGGHLHNFTKEAFFIVNGKIQVKLKKDDSSEKVIVRAGDFFVIEPGIAHSFEFLEDTTMVALYDKPIINDSGEKDIIPEEA